MFKVPEEKKKKGKVRDHKVFSLKIKWGLFEKHNKK
jgi:hypothetical protein